MKKVSFSGVLLLISVILFIAWLATRIAFNVYYNANVDGHLKRAADANSITTAASEVKVALDFMEKHGLTSGYTSILYKTPSEDVGFWYNNIKSAYDELIALDPNTTPLEKTNVLMKLRETLMDEGESAKVTSPQGISIYPNNVASAWWGFISVLVMAITGIAWGNRDYY